MSKEYTITEHETDILPAGFYNIKSITLTKDDIEDIIYGLKCFETYDEGYANPLIEKLQELISNEPQ